MAKAAWVQKIDEPGTLRTDVGCLQSMVRISHTWQTDLTSGSRRQLFGAEQKQWEKRGSSWWGDGNGHETAQDIWRRILKPQLRGLPGGFDLRKKGISNYLGVFGLIYARSTTKGRWEESASLVVKF